MKYNNKVSAATIARTAALLLALANQILSAFGKSPLPIESSTVEQLVTTGITTVTALINWWYNNSFTQAAIEGDKTYELYMEQVNPQDTREIMQAEDTLTALLKLVENRELRDAIDRAAGRVAYLREVAAFEAGYGFMPE